jgi:hypothetical protein
MPTLPNNTGLPAAFSVRLTAEKASLFAVRFDECQRDVGGLNAIRGRIVEQDFLKTKAVIGHADNT